MQKTKLVNYKGVNIKEHELDTIRFLEKHGYRVEPIRPTLTPKNKNPDILLNGAIWEMKCPESNKKSMIERRFSEAGGQSSNIIFDLRRCKLSENTAIGILTRCFNGSGKIRRMKIIKKTQEMLDFKKRK